MFRRRAIPYAIATFSHFLIGDALTGNPPLLFGISEVKFGALAPWVFAQYGAAHVAFLLPFIWSLAPKKMQVKTT